MKNIPTPCHIIDLDAVQKNLERVYRFKQLAGCEVFLAVKGFSAPYLFPKLIDCLDGVSASGLYEAKLGREYFGKTIQTYSPAFQEKHIKEIAIKSNMIVFNSISQYNKYADIAKQNNCSCGIRINPLLSNIKKSDANPCKPHSHLGIPITQLPNGFLHNIDGIHVHSMCEEGAESLEILVDHLMTTLGKDLGNLKWINLGGGQMIGHEKYDYERAAACVKKLSQAFDIKVILEPCEGILTECGYFATKVLDLVDNNGKIAILDTSPICHMQDAVFRGWTREAIGEADNGYKYLLCGQTCFAGDTFGWYTFKSPLAIDDVIIFKDTASYTWVKNNAFNGIPFPSICTYDKKNGLKVVKEYGYNEFFATL